jgi:hypothetical protein
VRLNNRATENRKCAPSLLSHSIRTQPKHRGHSRQANGHYSKATYTTAHKTAMLFHTFSFCTHYPLPGACCMSRQLILLGIISLIISSEEKNLQCSERIFSILLLLLIPVFKHPGNAINVWDSHSSGTNVTTYAVSDLRRLESSEFSVLEDKWIDGRNYTFRF